MEEGRGKDKEREEGEWSIAFWNVVGLRDKDRNFWMDLREWDVMVLSEIWVDKKG